MRRGEECRVLGGCSLENNVFYYLLSKQMAKAFGYGKGPNYWLATQAAKDFIDALIASRNLDAADLQQVVIIEKTHETITARGFSSLDKFRPFKVEWHFILIYSPFCRYTANNLQILHPLLTFQIFITYMQPP